MRGALALLLCGCAAAPPADAGPRERVVTILATAEIRGTPEPCGCQSDPLGDVARVASLLAEARARGGALLVDAGGLRYSADPLKPAERGQADLKAKFLEQAWQDEGVVAAVGDEDLRFGKAGLDHRLQPGATTVRELDGVKVGVFAVADPAKIPGAQDPVTTAKSAVAQLRGAGAQLVIGLAHLGRADARRLARAVPEVSIVVAGDEVEEGAEAEQVDKAILLTPAKEAMRVARVELHLGGGRISTQLFAGAAERAREIAKLSSKIKEIEQQLAALQKDPAADPAFVKTIAQRKSDLIAERAKLEQAPAAPPAGPYATADLIPVKRAIARDAALAGAMKKLDAEVGEANRKAGERVPVPPAAKGEPHYVGIDECELCHDGAVKLWKGTVHAKAWQELVSVNKQWSFDCIKCHVTGYGQPGGSAMAHVDKLESVQCEVCHGPGSLHAAKPKKVKLTMPEERDCKGCHTVDHSDTFDFTAYLRDVLGQGHGEKRRQALGDGKTGHELRSAAMEKAAATR
jgi:hypothetical protein